MTGFDTVIIGAPHPPAHSLPDPERQQLQSHQSHQYQSTM
jgi:hypothetical protein